MIEDTELQPHPISCQLRHKLQPDTISSISVIIRLQLTCAPGISISATSSYHTISSHCIKWFRRLVVAKRRRPRARVRHVATTLPDGLAHRGISPCKQRGRSIGIIDVARLPRQHGGFGEIPLVYNPPEAKRVCSDFQSGQVRAMVDGAGYRSHV